MMRWQSMCRCKIVGVIVSIGNFLLKRRRKICFCFLVNTFRYRTGRVHECWGWWRVVCAKGERRGFLSEGCYSSHLCCPTKRGRVYLKRRLFHENARRFDVYCHFIYLPEVPVETSPLKTDPTWLFLCSPSNKNDSREISPNAMTTLLSGFTFLTSRSRLLRVTAWLSNARCSSWIFEVPAVLQMPPALPVPSFYDNIHPLSYAVRRSINHHMMAIIVCG